MFGIIGNIGQKKMKHKKLGNEYISTKFYIKRCPKNMAMHVAIPKNDRPFEPYHSFCRYSCDIDRIATCRKTASLIQGKKGDVYKIRLHALIIVQCRKKLYSKRSVHKRPFFVHVVSVVWHYRLGGWRWF